MSYIKYDKILNRKFKNYYLQIQLKTKNLPKLTSFFIKLTENRRDVACNVLLENWKDAI